MRHCKCILSGLKRGDSNGTRETLQRGVCSALRRVLLGLTVFEALWPLHKDSQGLNAKACSQLSHLYHLKQKVRKSNLDFVLAELRDAGFAAEAYKMDSVQHGVPQNRRRVYIIGQA